MKQLITVLAFVVAARTAQSQTRRITVAQNGSGDFTTIQAAIEAVADYDTATTIISIKNGIYKEKLVLPETKTNVHFEGEDVMKTILTYDDYASKKDGTGKDIGTSGSATFYIYGAGFSATNITFENSAGPVGQAVAVRVTGDRARFINCRFLGFQDTLYTHGTQSRQYYFKCYIEGTVDFIFGAATALFDSCTLFGKKGGYYTAASTPQGQKYGYVFRHCTITGSAAVPSFMLGRPWRPFAKTVFLHCLLDSMVLPKGWDNWGKTDNEQTTFYAEYGNTGKGAATAGRVKWAYQLSREEASLYQLSTILNGWNPLADKQVVE